MAADGAALALVLKALSLAAILLALAEPHWLQRKPRSRWRCWWILRPACRRQIWIMLRRSLAEIDQRSQGAALDAGDSVCAVDAVARCERGQVRGICSRPRGNRDALRIWRRAVREAVASLPAGLVPRVALISDGKQNKGSVARAAWQAQQLGIPIDTFAMKGGRSRRCGWNRSACRRSRSRASSFRSTWWFRRPRRSGGSGDWRRKGARWGRRRCNWWRARIRCGCTPA